MRVRGIPVPFITVRGAKNMGIRLDGLHDMSTLWQYDKYDGFFLRRFCSLQGPWCTGSDLRFIKPLLGGIRSKWRIRG